MPPECPDIVLAGATEGDEGDIATLYRSFNPLLLRYLRHHVGHVAEDVASDVWLALASQLSEFDGTVHEFQALMFTIARRRTIDHYRRNGRQAATVPIDETIDCVCTSDTEMQAVEHLTAQSAVEALVGALPDDQAEIVLLRVLADLDVNEVAELVGKSNGAVRVSQHRALQRLKRTWSRKVVTQ
jgi:RNA polymerase sigma-70 factor (ECF subfamily)